MTSIIDNVQSVLKKTDNYESRFFSDYKNFIVIYQDLLDRGIVSKRQSQLLSISDRVAIAPIQFNYSKELF
jgi:hypothetical protein